MARTIVSSTAPEMAMATRTSSKVTTRGRSVAAEVEGVMDAFDKVVSPCSVSPEWG